LAAPAVIYDDAAFTYILPQRLPIHKNRGTVVVI